MNIKTLRERLPKKGYTKRIQQQIRPNHPPKQPPYSKNYIVCVINEIELNGSVAYNQEIIDAAIIVAQEYQAMLAKQGEQIEKLNSPEA